MIKAYVWLLGQPLAMIDAGGGVFYYHNDHLGTPQRVTDGGADVVWAADYLPFGEVDVIVGTVENNLRFAGQYYDQETGMHYNWNRYYDPKLGRYLRADPIGQKDDLNLYAYAHGNPIKYTDYKGLGVGCKIGCETACTLACLPSPIGHKTCKILCLAACTAGCPDDLAQPWPVRCRLLYGTTYDKTRLCIYNCGSEDIKGTRLLEVGGCQKCPSELIFDLNNQFGGPIGPIYYPI